MLASQDRGRYLSAWITPNAHPRSAIGQRLLFLQGSLAEEGAQFYPATELQYQGIVVSAVETPCGDLNPVTPHER